MNPIETGLRQMIRIYYEEGVELIGACHRLIFWQQTQLIEVRSNRFNLTPVGLFETRTKRLVHEST